MAKILIIEDNSLCMEMASELLKDATHTVFKAESASEGIESAIKHTPDLILMDLELPDIDGLSATRRLKENIETSDIPIVAFTARVMQSDRDEAFKAGCCGFISKPIDVSRFVHLVESFLTYKCASKININHYCVNKTSHENETSPVTEPAGQSQISCMDSLNNSGADSGILHTDTICDDNNNRLNPHNILIVDDNPMNTEIIKEVLEQSGQNSKIANNGQQALDFANREKFDLILLDIMMPEMSGFEVIRQLKSNPATENIPFIIISALDNTEDIIRGFNMGSYQYITKPFKINELKARILSILKIKDLNDQQENFMATLTHDLKTPILAQMRALEMLLNEKFGTINPSQKSIIQETLNSNIYMLGMVSNLLAAHNYENKHVVISKNLFDLNGLIKDCYNQLQYLADDKKQEVNLDFQQETLLIFADSLEIKRVIVNLISNAINYSEEGGQIFVSSSIDGSQAVFSVKDNGRGISKEELPDLFSKYKSFAKKFRQIGTGLGLYLSRQIVECHGGSICVTSEEGKGSVFTVKLPINRGCP